MSVVLMIALMGIASLAVDLARVFICKAELMVAAEAAARAGCRALEENRANIPSYAVTAALANTCDGVDVALNAVDDVTIGYWNESNRTFVPGYPPKGPRNAVRVTARRTANRGTGVPLMLASLLGVKTVDTSATATVIIPPEIPTGLIGLESVNFSSLGVLAAVNGDVLSNGNIKVGMPLGLLVQVKGDARSYNGAVTKGALAAITGSRARLDRELECPPVTVPSGNNNDRIAQYLNSAGDFNALVGANIPAGTYVVRDLNLLAGLIVHLEGPVTFYVTRTANIGVAVNLLGNTDFDPSNFRILCADGCAINFLAPLLVPFSADIYAPNTNVNIAVGVNQFRGRLVAKNLTIALPVLGSFNIEKEMPSPFSGHGYVLVE